MNPTPAPQDNADREKAKKPSSKKLSDNFYFKYSGMAFQMAAIILIGAFSGKKLDEYLGLEKPLMTVFFSLFAIAAALYLSLKDLFKP